MSKAAAKAEIQRLTEEIHALDESNTKASEEADRLQELCNNQQTEITKCWGQTGDLAKITSELERLKAQTSSQEIEEFEMQIQDYISRAEAKILERQGDVERYKALKKSMDEKLSLLIRNQRDLRTSFLQLQKDYEHLIKLKRTQKTYKQQELICGFPTSLFGL